MISRLLWKDGRRVTYGEIARGTGSHVTHIVKVFNGKRGVSVDKLAAISAFLGCPMEALRAALYVPKED